MPLVARSSSQTRILSGQLGHELAVDISDSMHPFSILAFAIFVAGYTTARWDLVTRLYELAIFAWDYGVIVRPICLRRFMVP